MPDSAARIGDAEHVVCRVESRVDMAYARQEVMFRALFGLTVRSRDEFHACDGLRKGIAVRSRFLRAVASGPDPAVVALFLDGHVGSVSEVGERHQRCGELRFLRAGGGSAAQHVERMGVGSGDLDVENVAAGVDVETLEYAVACQPDVAAVDNRGGERPGELFGQQVFFGADASVDDDRRGNRRGVIRRGDGHGGRAAFQGCQHAALRDAGDRGIVDAPRHVVGVELVVVNALRPAFGFDEQVKAFYRAAADFVGGLLEGQAFDFRQRSFGFVVAAASGQ